MPPFYDSLLAKLIAYGNTRDEALVRAYHALDAFIIEGIHTTIPFHREMLMNTAFAAGQVDTGFVERMQAS